MVRGWGYGVKVGVVRGSEGRGEDVVRRKMCGEGVRGGERG